jgi:hypothetical protein
MAGLGANFEYDLRRIMLYDLQTTQTCRGFGKYVAMSETPRCLIFYIIHNRMNQTNILKEFTFAKIWIKVQSLTKLGIRMK